MNVGDRVLVPGRGGGVVLSFDVATLLPFGVPRRCVYALVELDAGGRTSAAVSQLADVGSSRDTRPRAHT